MDIGFKKNLLVQSAKIQNLRRIANAKNGRARQTCLNFEVLNISCLGLIIIFCEIDVIQCFTKNSQSFTNEKEEMFLSNFSS